MPTSALDIPVFDADNHLYETRDALTKFLPDRYKGAIDYVEVRGRTKIVVRGRISEYIPNPTFDVVARPGAQEDYFRRGNPEGKSRREIEDHLLRHPEVQQAAVIGIPDERLGEVGMAFVVTRSGDPAVGADILAWCRDEIANYKVPRAIEIVDELPVNATGKVEKNALRARAARARPLPAP